MKTTFIKAAVLSLVAVASFSSFAEGGQDSKLFRDQPTVSTKTRQEVRAELAQAVSAGHTFYIDNSYPGKGVTTAVGGKTRAEVRAEIGVNSGYDNPLYVH
jgi:hypothetical protein